ncbi:MAG: ATP-grasp domain-containing protein [Anaerolineae bacterium]|nr:ATP-grasp domain-containing protein [Anaerolineae bacterium]
MFKHILIANRGEAALRVLRAGRELGVRVTLAVSTADRDSLPARLADRVVCIGSPPPSQSYLNGPALVQAALAVGAEAVHPGYGFLAESAAFVQQVTGAGLVFVGPPAGAMARLGDKAASRALAVEAGVPVAPGSPPLADVAVAQAAAERVGYPLLLKAVAGGGGRGIRRVDEPAQLAQQFATAQAEAQAAFGDGTVYVEKLVTGARHVEVQVLADGLGNVLTLGERDCSVQRRRQKLVEMTPAPDLAEATRAAMQAAARRLAQAAGYVNAGTVEFLLDLSGAFYFVEMNCRLQVEHPVTEMVTGLDLVQEQLRIAAGEADYGGVRIELHGCALECRVNAEDPARGFAPGIGTVSRYQPPGGPGVRVDSHLYAGYSVLPWYDSLLAKLVVWGADRPAALARLRRALDEFELEGVPTTLPLHRRLAAHSEFQQGAVDTDWLEKLT